MPRTTLLKATSLLVVAAMLFLAACNSAAPTPQRATLDEIVNDVESRLANGAFGAVQPGFVLMPGGQVHTGDAASVRMMFDEGTIIRLTENTTFTLTGVDNAAGVTHTSLLGKVWVSIANGMLDVNTPVGVASVRGSYAVFDYEPGDDPNSTEDDTLTVSCLEGTCDTSTGAGDITLGNLEQLVVTHGGKSAEIVTLHDYDVEQFLEVMPESGGLVGTLTAGPRSDNANTIYGTARATMNENDRATRNAVWATQGRPGVIPDVTPGAPATTVAPGNNGGDGGGGGNPGGGGRP